MQSQNHGYWSRRAEKSFWLMETSISCRLKVYENLPSDILGVGDIVDRENCLSKMCCNLHRPGAFSILEPAPVEGSEHTVLFNRFQEIEGCAHVVALHGKFREVVIKMILQHDPPAGSASPSPSR